MPLYTLSQKKAIYKYREAHTGEYAEYNTSYCKQYYLENKEKLKSMKKNLYHYRRECDRLRNILLDI